jgi:hypothetical protein
MAVRRDVLHQVVDELPESEWPTAERFLVYLRDTASSVVTQPKMPAGDRAAEDDEERPSPTVENILRIFGRAGPGQTCEFFGDTIPAVNPRHGPLGSWTVVFPDEVAEQRYRPILESDDPGAFGIRAVSRHRKDRKTGQLVLRLDDVSLIRGRERAAARD